MNYLAQVGFEPTNNNNRSSTYMHMFGDYRNYGLAAISLPSRLQELRPRGHLATFSRPSRHLLATFPPLASSFN